MTAATAGAVAGWAAPGRVFPFSASFLGSFRMDRRCRVAILPRQFKRPSCSSSRARPAELVTWSGRESFDSFLSEKDRERQPKPCGIDF